MSVHVEVYEHVNPLWWDERLTASPEGSIFQTTYWAEFLRVQEGVEPLFLVAREHEEVVGLWMLMRGCQWQEQSHLTRTPSRHISRYVAPEYRWNYGPVVLRADSAGEIVSALCRGLDELASSERVWRVVGCHPPGDADRYRRAFAASVFFHQPRATFLVDTTADVDVLWKRLQPSARKAVRQCEAQGMGVERIEHEGQLTAYYEMLRETRVHPEWDMLPHFPNTAMWNFLRPGGHLEVFLARQGKRVLAGMGVFAFNGVVTEVGAVLSSDVGAERIWVGDLLKWHIIRWAHEQGHHTYDLAGVALNPASEQEERIYQFKAGWGGRLVRCDEFSKVYPTRWRQWACGRVGVWACGRGGVERRA